MVGGRPDFVGVPTFPGHDDVEDWRPEMPDAWDTLRASDAASNLCVVLPRVLLRLPYGKAGEECATFRFEEVDPGFGHHGAFLWGSGALAAAVIALTPMADGDSAATHGTIDSLPLHITTVDGLPESPGVYTFVGASGQPLYVGKARNLRERVRGHFYADSRNANDARLVAEVHAIDVETTAGEFGALLLEMQRIKACVPLHNVALRKRETTCFLRADAPGRAPPCGLYLM